MPKTLITNGLDGDDVILGTNVQDLINGGGGDDDISGGNQHDTLNGGTGGDAISGDNGKDVVNGDGGDDVLSGNNGKDKVDGGSGRDNISGGNGKDDLTAGPVEAGDADDFAGPNILSGGNGKDRIVSSFAFCEEEESDSDLTGSSGSISDCPVDDVMTGGRGVDTFVFFAMHGNDVITDFWKDFIDLSALGLTNGFDDLSIANNPDGDAVVATGEGTITLLGVDALDVDADAFIF